MAPEDDPRDDEPMDREEYEAAMLAMRWASEDSDPIEPVVATLLEAQELIEALCNALEVHTPPREEPGYLVAKARLFLKRTT